VLRAQLDRGVAVAGPRGARVVNGEFLDVPLVWRDVGGVRGDAEGDDRAARAREPGGLSERGGRARAVDGDARAAAVRRGPDRVHCLVGRRGRAGAEAPREVAFPLRAGHSDDGPQAAGAQQLHVQQAGNAEADHHRAVLR